MRYLLVAISLNFVVSYCLECPKNYFTLTGMTDCHALLNCADTNNVLIDDLIGEGAVKKVYKGFWLNQTIAINVLKEPKYFDDFLSGLNLLKSFHVSCFIVKLIGFCEEKNMFITEFHRLGDARNFPRILKTLQRDSLKNRLKFCLNYIEILEFIHSIDSGVRVMCDSNDLKKLLSQYLISEDLQLILNDVDALPSVAQEGKIRCGHRQIISNFAAPEQLWPFVNLTYNEENMSKYDEKTDIWKVPDVCEYFIGDAESHKILKYRLFEIHKLCKNQNPEKRPSATEIKQVYQKLLNDLSHHTEL